MKTFTFITVFLCSLLSLNAQVFQPGYVGDTLGPWSVITFDEPTPYISINPSSQNLWQIGAPQKQFFNQAYSAPNAMVTDTLNNYGVNNLSSFDLCIGDFNTNGLYNYDLFIDFRHKFDTDTLRDGGFISVSWDHRQTWMNIIDDTISKLSYYISPAQHGYWFGNTNLYGAGDTLFNGEHGFSGKSNGWVHSCMAWYDIPCKGPDYSPSDTMYLRFNFISDTIPNSREGWMIDDIRIFSIDLGSGIRDFLAGTKRAWLAPNPVKTSTIVTFDRAYSSVDYLLTDLSGRVLLQGKPGKCNEFSVSRAGLSPGIYLLKISMDQNLTETHRIVVL
jgi:hypothetical protein